MLSEIVSYKRQQLDMLDLDDEITKLKPLVENLPPVRSLRQSILAEQEISIIAEIKRRSPSRGDLYADLDARELASTYDSAGARAISVLTEDKFFGGSADDLIAVRMATSLPILRKDFILEEFQLWQSRQIGADAVLLIADILPPDKLLELFSKAVQIGLEMVIEVHSETEMDSVLALRPKIIGINNRNLKTFEVDIETFKNLAEMVPQDTVCISESGVSSYSEMVRLRDWGADAVLIGEGIVTSGDPYRKIRELKGEAI
jgi:indole-3-glycerol phosphate synthase